MILPLSTPELRAHLLSFSGSASMVSVILITDPAWRAKNESGEPNPYRVGKGESAQSLLVKINKCNGPINGKYDPTVENRLAKQISVEREANGLPPLDSTELRSEILARFRKGESWHRPIMDGDKATCLSVHKRSNDDDGEAYLRIFYGAYGTPVYVWKETGEVEPTEKVTPFLKPSSEYENQGLGDDAARIICPKVSNIGEIVIDGERYRIPEKYLSFPIETREVLWRVTEEYLSGERKMHKV